MHEEHARGQAEHAKRQAAVMLHDSASAEMATCCRSLRSIPAVPFCGAGLPMVGSSAIGMTWLAGWEGAGGVVLLAASAGESLVERAEAGGALVLTGRSAVVRPLPAMPHNSVRRLLAVFLCRTS